MLSQTEEIVALRRATDETKALVEERFPFVVEGGANDDFASFRWPTAAAGLLARGVAIMDTAAPRQICGLKTPKLGPEN